MTSIFSWAAYGMVSIIGIGDIGVLTTDVSDGYDLGQLTMI